MRRRDSAFSLVEILTATALFSVVAAALFLFMTTAMRLITRNLATNHSHDTVRASTQRMITDLHNSSSAFRLVRYDPAAIPPVTELEWPRPWPLAAPNVDQLTGDFISERANGVAFRRMLGGPFRLTANTLPEHSTLTFDFSSPQGVFVPLPGDKILMPLISMQYDVVNVLPTGQVSIVQSVGTVQPARVGFTLDTGGSNITTGYFFRRAAYVVLNGELRFHPNFFGDTLQTSVLVRENVTSPNPFSLLFPRAGGYTDFLKLRVSLEAYDGQYSSRRFMNATTTLQTVIPPRNQPTLLSVNN